MKPAQKTAVLTQQTSKQKSYKDCYRVQAAEHDPAIMNKGIITFYMNLSADNGKFI